MVPAHSIDQWNFNPSPPPETKWIKLIPLTNGASSPPKKMDPAQSIDQWSFNPPTQKKRIHHSPLTNGASPPSTKKKRIQLGPLTNGASTATQPQLCRFLVPTTTSSHLPGSPSWGVDPGEVDLTSMWWPRFGRPCKGAMMRTESAGGAAHQLQGGAVRLVAALPFQRPARAPSAAFAGGKATH